MCGLTGIVDFGTTDLDALEATVCAMTEQLRHRGPDDIGIWREDGVCLGHRRLSIQDLSSAGAQPMHSASGRHVIVYNGEIYNHLDLRRELDLSGAAPEWRGHSDTETLLAGIEFWGLEETLRKSAGMFALALWDRQARQLSLARDRIGEKPLYWGWAGQAIVFGSELKSLRKHPRFPNDVSREALSLYLQFSYVPAPYSIHPGVFKLEPGCILKMTGRPPIQPPKLVLRPGYSHETISIQRYWSMNDVIEAGAEATIEDEQQALAELDQRLGEAVERQMISDVPIGAFLSGGIDSSLIVATMQARAKEAVRTFTIGFEDAAFDEAPCAAAVAAHLGTDHTELYVTEADARSVIPLLPEMYDEPFADSSQIATHLVCAMARRSVVVALSGDAGDELFGGYNRYIWSKRIWQQMGWMPQPVRQMLGRAFNVVSIGTWDRLGAAMPASMQVRHLGDKVHKVADRFATVKGLDDLYRSLVSEWPGQDLVVGATRDTLSVLDDPLPALLGGDAAARMMAQDMRSYLPDDILCKVDRASMAVSLETRVPFLDPDVIAFSARVPMSMKIRDGKGKWILRKLLEQHVPASLFDRPKTGFSIPLGAWLRGPLRAWAEDLLSPAMLTRDGVLNPEPIRAVWAEHLNGRVDRSGQLWVILMFMAWRNSDRWET
jgi:asparagine synthase (glutamine-hydrolysing)